MDTWWHRSSLADSRFCGGTVNPRLEPARPPCVSTSSPQLCHEVRNRCPMPGAFRRPLADSHLLVWCSACWAASTQLEKRGLGLFSEGLKSSNMLPQHACDILRRAVAETQ